MQFREMALGGSQEVPGQSVATPVMPSGAIAQHLFCILYFVFMSNSEKNMYIHKLAHFYNEVKSKGAGGREEDNWDECELYPKSGELLSKFLSSSLC